MNFETLPYINLGLGLLCLGGLLYCAWQIYTFNHMRKMFFAGTQASSLETVIQDLVQNIHQLQEEQRILEHSLVVLKNNFDFSIQKIGVIRFNPFADGGGNLSFSIALLDGHENGIIITSMHGREQNRIYTKKVTSGATEVELTEEEKRAVYEARNFHTAHIA